MKKKILTIAVLGLGWSGSSALVDLFEQNKRFSCLKFELDIWREPITGLMFSINVRNLRKSFLKLTARLLKVTIRHMVSFLRASEYRKKNGLMAVIQCITIAVCALFTLVMSFGFNSQKAILSLFVKNLKYFLTKNRTSLVLDQPTFVELIEEPSLGHLSVEATVFVLRDAFDQVADWQQNHEIINVKTIREGFFVGMKRDIHIDSSSHQLNLMILTLEMRVHALEKLIKEYPDKFIVLKFENLVRNTNQVVQHIDEQLSVRGFSGFCLSNVDFTNFFDGSRKNIGIYNSSIKLNAKQIKQLTEINQKVECLLNVY